MRWVRKRSFVDRPGAAENRVANATDHLRPDRGVRRQCPVQGTSLEGSGEQTGRRCATGWLRDQGRWEVPETPERGKRSKVEAHERQRHRHSANELLLRQQVDQRARVLMPHGIVRRLMGMMPVRSRVFVGPNGMMMRRFTVMMKRVMSLLAPHKKTQRSQQQRERAGDESPTPRLRRGVARSSHGRRAKPKWPECATMVCHGSIRRDRDPSWAAGSFLKR